MVSSASASDSWVIVGSEMMIVGVGGALVAEAERQIVTLRLFMRPYPTDKDLEEIAVELVSVGCDDEGSDGPTVWLSLIDVRNEVICVP